jgi:hypothetical protein
MDSTFGNLSADDKKDIFEALGAGNIPDEEKGELLAKMAEVVQTRTLLRIADELPPEKQEELQKFAEVDDPEGLEDFITQNVPDLENIFLDEAKKLKEELIIKLSK